MQKEEKAKQKLDSGVGIKISIGKPTCVPALDLKL
jgi:hypothetical protein